MPFPPAFDHAWDITQPPDTQAANLLGQDIRFLKDDVMQRMSLLSGTFVNRPTPEILNATWGGAGFGLLYFSTDSKQIFQWNGAVWVDVTSSFAGTGYKSEGVNIVPVTVANTVALTPLQGIVIPANDIGASQTFYLDACGVMGANANPTLVLGVYLDGVLLDNLSPTTGSITQSWMVKAFFTCTLAGVVGKTTSLIMQFNNSLVPPLAGVVTPGLITVDTTAPHTLQLQAQWGVAAAANTITSNAMTCYRVG